MLLLLLQFSANDPARWLLIIGTALIILFLVFKPMLRKKKDPLEKTPFSSLSQRRSVEREMSNLLVELSEMSRQISAQLDTRSSKLELLIREADEKIEALRRAGNGAAMERVSPSERHVEPIVPPSARIVEVEPPQSTAPPVQELAPIDPRHAEVYALADEGQSASQIAQQLGRPSGEIELILALRRSD